MQFKRSIQKRVFAIFGGFTLVVALAYSVATLIVAYIIEDEVLNRLVAQEVKRIEARYQQSGELPKTSAAYFDIYSQVNLAPSEIAAAARASNVAEVFSASGRHYHIRSLRLTPVSPNNSNAILVADVTDLLAVRNLPSNVIVFLTLLMGVAIIAAVAGALIITRRTTKPLVELAQRVVAYHKPIAKPANNIGSEKSTQSIATTLANDEVEYLALTIEAAFTQLQAVIERESQFNRDVSHELRTPLTEILNTLALAQHYDPQNSRLQGSNKNHQLNVQPSLSTAGQAQLATSANSIKNIVTTLLALARAETVNADTYNIQPLIEECVLGLYPKIQAHHFNVECNLTGATVVGNRQLTGLVINNLIENAINHSSKPSLTITVAQGVVHFDNTFASALPADLAAPNKRAQQSDGIGQGLYLVKRILEALHWQYAITTINNPATYRFSIHFIAAP